MPRTPRPAIGRVHTHAVLRALASSEGGSLHYTALLHKVSVEAGRPISGLNILLHDLDAEGLVTRLDDGEGYQITESGRTMLAALDATEKARSSTRKGGVGAR